MITNKVILVRPYAFNFNTETAVDNVYQVSPEKTSEEEIQERALKEFDQAVEALREKIFMLISSKTLTRGHQIQFFPTMSL